MLYGMRAVNFVIETLSHYTRGIQGPPPGVPFAADAEFETDLVALCRHQRLSAMVSESFEALALPPTVSRITIARLDDHADMLSRASMRRVRLAGRVAAALSSAGVPAALLGDAWTAAQGPEAQRLRPVGWIDLMIDEARWSDAVAVLRQLGFVRSRIQPRLADPSHALRYHQYFAPLVMHNHDGDAVRLKFRVIDFGDPGRTNPAWDRIGHVFAGGQAVPVVAPEDQLVHSVISFGAEGFVDLLYVLDAGWILSHSTSSLDWEYIARRLRDRGYYAAFYCTLEHAGQMLGIRRVAECLDAPSALRRRAFHACWRPGEADYYGETEPTSGRFSYGLIEGGGPLAKMLWLRRALFPRSAWVRSVYGRPANLWLRLKFLHDVRSGRRRRYPDTPDVFGGATGMNELR
jgi:hypothetical protein